jgi:hypothetical protein
MTPGTISLAGRSVTPAENSGVAKPGNETTPCMPEATIATTSSLGFDTVVRSKIYGNAMCGVVSAVLSLMTRVASRVARPLLERDVERLEQRHTDAPTIGALAAGDVGPDARQSDRGAMTGGASLRGPARTEPQRRDRQVNPTPTRPPAPAYVRLRPEQRLPRTAPATPIPPAYDKPLRTSARPNELGLDGGSS